MPQRRRSASMMALVVGFGLLLTMGFSSAARATLLFEENFNFTGGTTLIGQGGWVQTGTAATPVISISSGSLSYPTYASSGLFNKAALGTSGDDNNHPFTTQTTGNVYASALVNVSAAQATGDYFFHFTNSTAAANNARLTVKSSGAGFVFGLSKGTEATVYGATVYSFSTTYLVVIKYTIVAGATNDVTALFVSPAVGGTEPTADITSPSTGTDLANVAAICLRQGSAANAPTATVDGIRVGTAWAEVVAAAPTYTLTASAGLNGTVTPAGVTTVSSGANQSYVIAASSGYHIVDVLVDGASQGAIASYDFTNVTANHTISATFAINTYTITASTGGNGTVTPAGVTTVNSGGSQSYAIAPSSGYHIVDVLVDGASQGAITSYNFTGVVANHTISATFAINTYTITASSGGNGTVTPAGVTTVNSGGSQSYAIAASSGYHIVDVLVDGATQGAIASYNFTGVVANHTISATFAINTYTITASSGGNGTVTPAGVTTVNSGGSQSYAIAASSGYHIVDVLVDGATQGAITSYNFTGVVANHTISATFAINTYTITASTGGNGTVTPAGVTTVNSGGSQSYAIAASSGYHIVDVLVDGATQGPIASYDFTGVVANHTISATFAINTYTITATTGGNGTVTPAGVTTVNSGGSQSYAIAASSGYHIVDVLVDGATQGPIASYDFTGVVANHTISATFAINTYTITATAGSNGTVTPAGVTTVNSGGSQSYAIAASSGYHIVDVLVDGASQGAIGSYDFTGVVANHTIEASFAIDVVTYTITATTGGNGTVTPAGVTTVNSGGSQAYAIAASSGYHIVDVLVDGATQGPIASYDFTGVVANHTISATFAINTYTITATAGSNGTVTPDGVTTVNSGGSQSYAIAASPGYHIVDVLVDGATQGAIASYDFTGVVANHTISATFAINTYTITATTGGNGTVTPAGVTTVNSGGSQSYAIAASPGYHIVDVLVDGATQGAIASYDFTGVVANHTISATFAINTYTITATTGGNGTVTPAGVTTVNSGGSQSYAIAASSGYHIVDVLVDGATQGAIASYDFTGVVANHTISATFAINTYTITATTGGNGTVTPAGVTTVNSGGSQSYAIAASSGYHIVDVLVDGATQGPIASYDFTGVVANHTIEATFAINTYTITATTGGNGTVTPAGVTTVNSGGSQSYVIAASSGYHIVDVLVDGATQGPIASYDFTGVVANHTIEASFAINTYTITATTGGNGTVTPAGVTTVNSGGSQSYAIAASSGYHIVDVLVDGATQGPIASYDFTGVVANHTIEASFAINTYTITATTGGNGTVTPAGVTTVNSGGSQSYAIAASSGYHIVDVLVDGATQGPIASYDFTGVVANHTIEASFAINTYTITATTGGNGTVTPAGVTTVNSGGSQSYAIAASPGYHILDVLVDGATQGPIASYDFTGVVANHTISATFAINTYTITATTGGNGTVTPAGVTTVNSGGSQSYVIAASSGYHIVDVLVDGATQGAISSYDFTGVVANHTISATFAINTYTITATTGGNGTVTPAGVTTVNSGGSQSYVIAASSGYHIVDVLVDGATQGAIASYDFTGVVANHTISATFATDPAVVSANSPSGVVSPNTPSLTVPVTIVRPYTTAMRLFHIKFQLGGGLTLSGGTAGVTAGGFLSASGATTHFQVVDSGGGSYTADGSILGLPCNATGLTGTLFNIAVASSAASGPGSVTLTEVTLRDCDNADLVSSIGSAASVDIDNTAPAVAVVAPNGGEFWVRGSSHDITWTASDAAGFGPAPVSIELSTNNGSTWSSIATALANSGTYAWTIPASVSTSALVRVHATDVFGNVGEDASDAVFTIAGTTSTALASSPNPSISGDGVLLTATVTPVAPEVGVPSGTVTFYDGPTSIGTGTLNGFGVATSSPTLVVVGAHSLTAVYGGDGSFTSSTSTALSHEVLAKIVASSGSNGSVSPSGTTTYSLNATPTFTFTADAGYHVASVLVDAVSVGPAANYTFAALTANHTLAVSFAVNPAVAAITGLAAVQVKTGNDFDGTTKVTLTWPSVGANKTVKVYRARYGNYPEYDDAPSAGSVPPIPSYPPPATWQLTSVGTSGDADEVATRDLWYFVAFVQDEYGTISPASNLAGGVLNYHLGDVTDGITPGHGNNAVDIADVTLLGAHYGLSGVAVAPYAYLDVGPTTNHTVNGRPVTDDLLDFEDLVMFAINFEVVSAPQAGSRPALVAADTDELSLEVPAAFTQGRATARLRLSGTGVVQGLSAKLSWDPAVVTVESYAPGALLDAQGALALSGKPGVIDIVRLGLGGGLIGTGDAATVTFRRIGEGDPKIVLSSVDARDGANAQVAMTFTSRSVAVIPQFTSFDRVAPNPVRGSANLGFALAQGGPVELAVYGVDGRLVRSLLRDSREPGTYQITWDGRDQSGHTVAVGVYYARLLTPQGRFTRSLVYLQ